MSLQYIKNNFPLIFLAKQIQNSEISFISLLPCKQRQPYRISFGLGTVPCCWCPAVQRRSLPPSRCRPTQAEKHREDAALRVGRPYIGRAPTLTRRVACGLASERRYFPCAVTWVAWRLRGDKPLTCRQQIFPILRWIIFFF